MRLKKKSANITIYLLFTSKTIYTVLQYPFCHIIKIASSVEQALNRLPAFSQTSSFREGARDILRCQLQQSIATDNNPCCKSCMVV